MIDCSLDRKRVMPGYGLRDDHVKGLLESCAKRPFFPFDQNEFFYTAFLYSAVVFALCRAELAKVKHVTSALFA